MIEQDILRDRVKVAKALNSDWSYKQMSEVIGITPHAFYNWLHSYYDLSHDKEIKLKSLIMDLLDR